MKTIANAIISIGAGVAAGNIVLEHGVTAGGALLIACFTTAIAQALFPRLDLF